MLPSVAFRHHGLVSAVEARLSGPSRIITLLEAGLRGLR